ncbi:MAG: hypothetical protein ACM3SY_01080 [Candidatus Omnitrophota bacterium]
MKFGKFVIFALCLILSASWASAQVNVLNFDTDTPGKPPNTCFAALTGEGNPALWLVIKDPFAVSAPNVVVQFDLDPNGNRVPLLIYSGGTYTDVTLSVKFRFIRGNTDRAAGLVWGFKDSHNYYAARANAFENNVMLYRVSNGKSTVLPIKGTGSVKGFYIPMAIGEWFTLKVVVIRNVFEVYLNKAKLFEVATDGQTQGKVGLWTRADSYIFFDDFIIRDLK